MSEHRNLELILGQAKEFEEKYEWLGAADSYKKALGFTLDSKDLLKAGEISERIGFCYYRGARQAETSEDFIARMRLAVESYGKAADLFGKADEKEKKKRGKSSRCMAMVSYINSWLAEDPSKKKTLLDDSCRLGNEALKVFEKVGDHLGYGKACNQLLEHLLDRCNVEWDWQKQRHLMDEAIYLGKKSITMLSEVGDDRELVRAYIWTSFHYMSAAGTSELIEKWKELLQKGLTHAEEAVKLSEKIGDAYLVGMSTGLVAVCEVNLGDFYSAAVRIDQILQNATKAKDNILLALMSLQLASLWDMMMRLEEDPDKKREGYKKVHEYAEDALHRSRAVLSYDFVADAYGIYAESYIDLGREVETDAEKKRALLEKAIEAGRNGYENAERSGSLSSVSSNVHSLSKALYFLSTMETDLQKKRILLEESLELRKKSINLVELRAPFYYWERGVYQNYLALIRAELARIETDKDKKRELLEKAVSNMEKCLKLCKKSLKERPHMRVGDIPSLALPVIGMYHDWFGRILNQLYSLTGDETFLQKAVEAYEGVVESYGEAGMTSRVAEARWQIAKAYDDLGNYSKSAENFESASKDYKASADEIPNLKELYTDYASYMQAWSEIEKARQSHEKEHYNQAKENYEKAASNLESSRIHGYMSPYFSAWAFLEQAEDLSRKEKPRQSITAFRQASETFGKAKESIETELSKIVSLDERENATELGKACQTRRDYCQGRIHLEEAKIHDREGDHLISAKKYGSASKVFQRVMKAVKSELERRDLLQTAYLCQAWQKMMMAEAKVSPELYLEASTLFEKAKEHSVKERTSLLSLGNNYFCKALEAGTRFEATRDMNLYSMAKRHLDSAATYYTKAGFEKASTWVNATEALFDAYVYMSNAEVEVSHKKKTKLYGLAEKHLERSAQLYEKAGYIGKRKEVLRSLKKVKEKWEFTLSLDEVLTAPSITSSTTLISTPTTQEEAVGLERFEHADIQANLIPRVQEVKIGEDISLEIELVNAGKGSALLIKVEEIIPEGFKLIEKPEVYRVEDRYLNMKGKRLPPLKAEEVKLVLRPLNKGTFDLKPRVLYLDETGKYKSYEPEPVTVVVKELGISGWLKGPSR